MQIFTLTRSDGQVTIMRLNAGRNLGQAVAAWEGVNAPIKIVAIAEIDAEQIPADRTFRGAWRPDEQNGIRHCMPTARNIHRDRMREKRKMLFSEVDAAYMRALMQGKTTDQIAAKAQSLRDITASEEIERADTPEALKELWPDDVLGETPYPAPAPRAVPVENYARRNPRPVEKPEPYAWAGNIPLWTKEDYDKFAAAAEAAAEAASRLRSEEPEPVAIADEIYPQDDIPPPPIIGTGSAHAGSLKDAMARVEAAEKFDAPLPEYAPPADQVSAVFDEPTHEVKTDRQRLRETAEKCNSRLNGYRWKYEIAVKVGHGNHSDEMRFKRAAEQRGVTIRDYADSVIETWNRCVDALTEIEILTDTATNDLTVDVEATIAKIEQVTNAALR